VVGLGRDARRRHPRRRGPLRPPVPEADAALRARLDELFRGVTGTLTEHGRLRRVQGTCRRVALGALSWWFLSAPAVGLEPTTLALTGPRSAD
jgi:hypothetical protein